LKGDHYDNDLTSIFKYINLFVFEGAIRPFTRSYFFGLTQKVTKKVKASSSPFLLVQEFFSFAVLRPDVSGRRVGATCRGDAWPGVCFV
jgi:hypothetical protein